MDTRSDEETDIKVELFASVATAFARYDLPVPGGYKRKRFLHNLLTMISLALINRTEYTKSLKQKDTQNPMPHVIFLAPVYILVKYSLQAPDCKTVHTFESNERSGARVKTECKTGL